MQCPLGTSKYVDVIELHNAYVGLNEVISKSALQYGNANFITVAKMITT